MSYSMFNSYCSHNPISVVDNIPSKVQVKGEALPTSSPEIFGPPAWAYLHISTVYLPENLNPLVATHIRNTIFAVPSMIPCEKCTIHIGNYIESRSMQIEKMTSGSEFFKLTVDMHNFVNERLGKKIMSYDQAFDFWKNSKRI